MTSFSSDQLAKQYLQEFLEPLGTVQRNFEVPGQAKYVDIWFSPAANALASQDLGLLGRMATTPCLLEPFRNAPTREEIDTCLAKRSWLLEDQRRRAKQEGRKLQATEEPRLWILGTTVYTPIVEEYEGRLQPDWLEGVYFLATHLRTALVALNKLPVTPDTLWLRILGKGRTQQGAIDELLALPQDDDRRTQALQLLVNWRVSLDLTDPQTAEERELMATLSKAYLEWEQRTLALGEQRGIALGEQRGIALGEQRGREQGRQEEAVALILRQITHRLGELPAALRTQVEALTLPQLENLGEALLDFQAIADLEAWLTT